MRVHVIGNAAVGKSSLIKAMMSHRVKRIESKSLCFFEPLSWRRATKQHLILSSVVFPNEIKLAMHFHQKLSNKKIARDGVYGWIAAIASERARSLLDRDDKILLVDQGLTNRIRKHCKKIPLDSLSKLPLPDMVIEVYASEAQRCIRAVKRSKPPQNNEIRTGEGRHKALRRKVRALFGEVNYNEIYEYMNLYNKKFCRPALGDETLRMILKEVSYELSSKKFSPHAEAVGGGCWLRQSYSRLGIKWMTVNSSHSNVDALAENTLKEIEKRIAL